MCFGNHKPLIPWPLCMCGSVSDALITAIVYGIPHINWIVQDGLHRSDRPCCMKASAFLFIMSSLRQTHRGRNSLKLIEPERNFCIAHTRQRPLKHESYIRRCFFIRFHAEGLIRFSPISVSRHTVPDFAFLFLHTHCTADFAGQVLGINVIHKIFNGNDQAILLGFIHTVIIVVDGNEPYVQEREDLFKVISSFQIISTKAR